MKSAHLCQAFCTFSSKTQQMICFYLVIFQVPLTGYIADKHNKQLQTRTAVCVFTCCSICCVWQISRHTSSCSAFRNVLHLSLHDAKCTGAYDTHHVKDAVSKNPLIVAGWPHPLFQILSQMCRLFHENVLLCCLVASLVRFSKPVDGTYMLV